MTRRASADARASRCLPRSLRVKVRGASLPSLVALAWSLRLLEVSRPRRLQISSSDMKRARASASSETRTAARDGTTLVSAAAAAVSRAMRGPRSGGAFDTAKAKANSAETGTCRRKKKTSKMRAIPMSHSKYVKTYAAAPFSSAEFIVETHFGASVAAAAGADCCCCCCCGDAASAAVQQTGWLFFSNAAERSGCCLAAIGNGGWCTCCCLAAENARHSGKAKHDKPRTVCHRIFYFFERTHRRSPPEAGPTHIPGRDTRGTPAHQRQNDT